MRAHLQIVLTVLLAANAISRSEPEDGLSKTVEQTANLKRKEILAEIAKLGAHDWAGDYYAGDGWGANISLILAPISGYVFERKGCLGVYYRDYAPVMLENGHVHLSSTFGNAGNPLQGMAPELIPVRWGERRYLVPADDIVGFCNNINAGREPRMSFRGFYLLRIGDEDKKADGMPELPIKYRRYLLTKPIEASIIGVGPYTTRPGIGRLKFKEAPDTFGGFGRIFQYLDGAGIGDPKFKVTPVTLDAGTKHGLLADMDLVVTKPEGTVESVRITKVESDRSEAIMIQSGEGDPGPKVGWRLSTRAPWHALKNTEN